MSGDFQQVIIIGNLGRDPEMRYTPTGQPVTSFSVAVNRQWISGSGEKNKETTWFNVQAWGKRGEVCNQYLRKGSKVMVTGRMTPDKKTGRPRVWTAQSGDVGASYELTALDVRFLSTQHVDGGAAPVGEVNDPSYEEMPPEDDIPF